MTRSGNADRSDEPDTYEARSTKLTSDGEPSFTEEGTWRTVIVRLRKGRVVETRIIRDGMTQKEKTRVHNRVASNPEAEFRRAAP